MLNLEEINNTIEELEHSDTTFVTCEKLASLYIVRDHYGDRKVPDGNEGETELSDILPQYRKYVELKRRYQLGELSERAIENSIRGVCKEISEFIHVLYRCTDMSMERECIKEMLIDLQNL